MRIVLLKLTEEARKGIKSDSILNHYPHLDSFYFSIPSRLSVADQKHLIKRGSQYLQSQFSMSIVDLVSVGSSRDIRRKNQHAKELSWEIFYHFNHWVKVCEGIYDQELDWFISGFSGKILDFYTDDENSIFLIAFSGDSVSKIPVKHLIEISRTTSPFYTFLESDLIVPDFDPVNFLEDEKKKMDLFVELSDFKEYPQENFENLFDLLKFWEAQFRTHLLTAEPVRLDSYHNILALLVDIPYFCERFGVWGTLLIGDKKIDIPLIEMEEILNNKILDNHFQNYRKTMTLILPN